MLAAGAAISLTALLPEIVLAVAACGVLIVGQAARRTTRQAAPWVALIGIVAALLILWGGQRWGTPTTEITIAGGLAFDQLAYFVRSGALIFGIVVLLVSWVQAEDAERGEFISMMLLSLTGLMLVGPAANLAVLFLALELVSIPTYVMVVLSRRGPRSLEGGTKYFFLGALAAAITAFGFSYIYGVTGSATLDGDAMSRFSDALRDSGSPAHSLATIGLLLSLVGLMFKIAAVPLHFYIADVYQGAASPVAGLLGFVPKLAGLVAIFKVFTLTGWQTTDGSLFWILWIVAALSMTVGNVLALRQTNIKRLLAYSGIAHSGYMLVGIIAGPAFGQGIVGNGTAAVLYYVMIYGIANLGAFALLGLLHVRGRPCETLRDVAGMLRFYPSIALLMALAMFTLMGLPPTPGFWGKLSLFGSALAAADNAPVQYHDWIIALVIIAVLNSALAAAYYLRVIAAVLLFENDQPAEPSPREAPMMGALLCGFLLLIFAFYPGALMRQGTDATTSLNNPPKLVHAALPDAETRPEPPDQTPRTWTRAP